MRSRVKKQRVIAVLLCLCLLAVCLLCGMTCAKNALHHCCSTNCPICDILQVSQQALKQLALAVGVVVVFVATHIIMLPVNRRQDGNVCLIYSLVGYKIRMNH